MTTQNQQPLEHFLEGSDKSDQLVVFLQGWPDNRRVWEPLQTKQNLSDKKVLFINFPNTTTTQPTLKWGQDFPVIISRLKKTLDLIGGQKYKKRIIVAHDWGCTYTYMFDKTYPNYFNQMITIDVPAYVELNSLKAKLMVLAYQLILIIAFVVGGMPGAWITKGVVKFFRYSPAYYSEITSARNYPYFYFYKNTIKGIFNKNSNYMRGYKPSIPVVYLYAKKKPFNFHGNRWINYLQENEKCELHGMQSNHWVMNKYGQFITDLIIRRLKMI